MIRNFILVTIRNIKRNPFYSILNIFGLAVGLTATFFIILFIKDEIGYDKHSPAYKRIYRLESHFTINNKDDLFAISQLPLGPTLKDEFPEVEEYVRFFYPGTMYFRYGDKEFKEDSVWLADSTVFRVFEYPLEKGNPQTALARPYTMVISGSLARRMFGDEDPMGKILVTMEGDQAEITGVFKDLPGNCHLRYNALLSTSTIAKRIGPERFNDRSSGSFWNINCFTYILLKDKADIRSILDKSEDFYNRHMKDIGDRINGHFMLMAKPLARTHHYSSDLQYDQPNGNFMYVWLFAAVAFFILLVACINYMNMATARSFNRSKEVGLRKMAGAQRSALMNQFLSESVFFAILAFLISLVLVKLLMPYFNQIAGKNISYGVIFSEGSFLIMLVLTFLTGIISGSYPAFYLSSFQPALVIKGRMDSSGGNGILRRILVVFQFFISALMITATFVLLKQLNYMQKGDLGFNPENLMVMTVRDTTFANNLKSFQNELMQNPAIEATFRSDANPFSMMGIRVMKAEGENGAMIERAVNNYFIDYDYITGMGITIIEGRNYDRNMATDKDKAYILNETAARKFGWIDSAGASTKNYSSAIGRKFFPGVSLDTTAENYGFVIGIMKDFHYKGMQNEIEPLVLLLTDDPRRTPLLNIRLKKGKEQEAIAFIDQKRKEFGDKYPFDYQFMDNMIAEAYKGEKRMGMLLLSFTILTIFLAILGLLGLASFLTQQRTREVALRKVVGADSSDVLLLFAKEFSKWVLIANLLALPVAWYLLGKWLQNFRYHIQPEAGIFILTLFVTLAVALLTVSFHVLRASRTNPAEALKYE
ncbi:MAG: FtsX-like permease family protein [Bacteroidales bacterium]|nr:FtsX-like permease family protein [Bacteroidales bacterium]